MAPKACGKEGARYGAVALCGTGDTGEAGTVLTTSRPWAVSMSGLLLSRVALKVQAFYRSFDAQTDHPASDL